MNVLNIAQKMEGRFCLLSHFDVLEVTGNDRQRFLSGQTSNEIVSLPHGNFILNSRLDRAGKLLTFFYHLKSIESDFLLVPKEAASPLQEDLEKYIIMDEVEVNHSNEVMTLLFSAYDNPIEQYELGPKSFVGSFGFLPAVLVSGEAELNKIKRIETDQLEEISLYRGAPVLGKTAKINQLVTDTVVNLGGVSLDKGCFLGQETVAKIETRRGGAYLPVALKLDEKAIVPVGEKIKVEGKLAGEVIANIEIDDSSFILASLLRNYRVNQKAIKIEVGELKLTAVVEYLPLGGTFSKEQYVDYLYENAVDIFQNTGNEEAIECFKEVLKVEPGHEDSLESIGVILGRMENFEEGIELMNQVLESNPDSVMAHTNKSLFFMRLGKIEEAEEEKAQATVKSFASFGKVATDKKEAEQRAIQEEDEINRRAEMFKQVLELDPEDELANYGMADIYHSRGKSGEAIKLLEKVISVNEKYSVAYLLLGKCYFSEKNKEKAKEVLEKGISVASGLGDLMPANEMQTILSRL